MSQPRSNELFKEGQAIVVKGRPALITNIGGDGSLKNDNTIHYNFINGDGSLSAHSGYCQPYDPDIKHIDFAEVRTTVKLPADWEKRAIEYDKAKASEKSVLDDWDPEFHPSYGTVRVGRCTGHTQLFMSPFKHQHYMVLSIHRSSKHRSLANDRTFSNNELIEVAFSEAQWARLVSSAGIGEGTPATIQHVAGEMMPSCPEQADIEKFHEDTKRYTAKGAESLDAAIKMATELLDKPSVSKAERKELLGKLTAARGSLTDALPFVATQLRERMEHIVSEGKTEIEAFFQRQVQRLGLKQIQSSPIAMGLLPSGVPKCSHPTGDFTKCPECQQIAADYTP
jgi:hypothetical protein